MHSPVATYFAPAGRDSADELKHREQAVQNAPLLRAFMDSVSQMVLVLNERRQVVAVNRCVSNLLHLTGSEAVGKRPGELFGCAHAKEGPDGCGTGTCCATCGAVEAIVESKSAGQATRECRLNYHSPNGLGALDLRVTATPVQVNGDRFTVCAIDDISHEKRLAVLQRMFFHDVLNTAGGIRGYTHLLAEEQARFGELGEDMRQLAALTDQLVEEIEAQRDLVYAEAGDLAVHPQSLGVLEFLGDLRALYASHGSAADRQLSLGDVWAGQITTDRRLLARVLGNMIRNALEASAAGECVTIQCVERGPEVEFRVHNPAVMPELVQLQIFHRSFSTKGQAGRGVGTHSIKLLGERYLRGRVSFTTGESEGTTFRICLPKAFPSPAL